MFAWHPQNFRTSPHLPLTCAKGRACLIITLMIALIHNKFAPDLLRRA